MLVRIAEDIFSNIENDSELDNLLPFFKLGKHQLNLNSPNDLLAFDNSSWKKKLKGDNLRLIQKGLKRVSNRKEIIISNNNAEVHFSIREAYLFLDQSLVILVENKEFEPPFINAIIKNFDNNEIDDAHKNKWWKYEMFAGSSVEQVIAGELKDEFNNEVFVKNKKEYLRYFVILDNDKTHFNMVNNTVESKIKFLDSVGVNYHILLKREKENYIPEKQLTEKKSNYFNCYLRVFKDSNKRQRDFFDIEKGFYNKNQSDGDWKNNRKDEAIFFEIANIVRADWDTLKKGVENKREFKSSFSNEFESVNKNDFLQVIKYQPLIRSNHDGVERNEFEHIVNEIKRLL